MDFVHNNMKYPWVSLAIIGVWLGSAVAIWTREDASPEKIFAIAMVTTIVLAIIGFKSPKSGLPV